jgi:amidase
VVPILFVERSIVSADLLNASALTQARLIREKQISPLELTQVYLDRIEQNNPQLGSFFYVAVDRAISLARSQTEILSQSDATSLPPFFGIPTAIKDLNPVAGMPCTYGSPAMRDYIPPYSDGIVSLMEGAGFNIIGKTAISELASFPYTEPTGFPPARNPWNLDYTPGGSSGGAAAAVAAKLIPIAHGSDGGGSLRGPAHCCGLVGIKPTRGRVSDAPVGDRISGLAAMGPIARTVADAAALLDIMATPLPGDPYLLPSPTPSFLAAAAGETPPLKIGMCDRFIPFGKCCDRYSEILQTTAQLLTDLGHELTEITIDTTGLIDAFTTVWAAGVAMAELPLEVLSPVNRYMIETKSGTAGAYLRSLSQLQVWSRQFAISYSELDVLLLPVYMHETIKVGAWADLSPSETFTQIAQWIVPAPIFNATGQPIITLPMGLELDTGLPIGIQLAGKLGSEALLIALAGSIERSRPLITCGYGT